MVDAVGREPNVHPSFRWCAGLVFANVADEFVGLTFHARHDVHDIIAFCRVELRQVQPCISRHARAYFIDFGEKRIATSPNEYRIDWSVAFVVHHEIDTTRIFASGQ